MTIPTTTTILNIELDKDTARKFRNFSIIAGILLVLAGIAGAVLPLIMSLVVSVFTGWMLIIGGALMGYLAWASRGRTMTAFIKPVLLIITGGLFIFFPIAGLAALALLLTVYLLLDAFSGFGLAYDLYPAKGWGWMAFNGLMSFVLALVLFIGWPLTSPLMIGLLVGLSLIFDGIAMIFIGIMAGKAAK